MMGEEKIRIEDEEEWKSESFQGRQRYCRGAKRETFCWKELLNHWIGLMHILPMGLFRNDTMLK